MMSFGSKITSWIIRLYTYKYRKNHLSLSRSVKFKNKKYNAPKGYSFEIKEIVNSLFAILSPFVFAISASIYKLRKLISALRLKLQPFGWAPTSPFRFWRATSALVSKLPDTLFYYQANRKPEIFHFAKSFWNYFFFLNSGLPKCGIGPSPNMSIICSRIGRGSSSPTTTIFWYFLRKSLYRFSNRSFCFGKNLFLINSSAVISKRLHIFSASKYNFSKFVGLGFSFSVFFRYSTSSHKARYTHRNSSICPSNIS